MAKIIYPTAVQLANLTWLLAPDGGPEPMLFNYEFGGMGPGQWNWDGSTLSVNAIDLDGNDLSSWWELYGGDYPNQVQIQNKTRFGNFVFLLAAGWTNPGGTLWQLGGGSGILLLNLPSFLPGDSCVIQFIY